jgi:ribosome-associated translation inhibitor RaiA
MEKDMLLKIVTKAENEELFNSLTRVEKKLNTQKRRQKHC